MSTALNQGHIPPSRLPYRLLIARLEAGLKQEELAELMGCGRTVVSNAEKGKGPVRKIVLNAWALATGVPINWLERGDGGWYPPEDGPGSGSDVRPKGFEPPTFWLAVPDNVTSLFPPDQQPPGTAPGDRVSTRAPQSAAADSAQKAHLDHGMMNIPHDNLRARKISRYVV